MRRLTELDLDALPAIGSIARGTPALIERRGGERFRLFPPGARPLRRRGRRSTWREGLGRMKDTLPRRRMWRAARELKRRYDVVIIGGGSHGLATAYYLAKNHGDHERRRARAVLHRLGRVGPQHDDHPLELPHARGRGVLQAERRALRGALGASSTST